MAFLFIWEHKNMTCTVVKSQQIIQMSRSTMCQQTFDKLLFFAMCQNLGRFDSNILRNDLQFYSLKMKLEKKY